MHQRLAFLAVIVLSGIFSAATARAQTATVSNVEPRYDQNGEIVDAHDGCLVQFGGKFYLYGTCYGPTFGWTTPNHYRCYSSTDLMTWTLENSNLLVNQPLGVHFRPYVIYNANTGKYVLWYNWSPSFIASGSHLGVATSDSPVGPFVIQNTDVGIAGSGPGDLGLFVDDDRTAYLIYGSNFPGRPWAISVERLSGDYLSSTRANSGVLADHAEAPALIKRNGLYYAIFDHTCPYCPQGSGAQVWTASNPLGPYTYRNNINSLNGDYTQPVINAQQTHVAKIATPNGDIFFWMGDRWHSAADGIKGHDFQYWSSPLQFDGAGNIAPITWTNNWSVQLSGGDGIQPRLLSASSRSNSSVQLIFSEAVDPASAQSASNYSVSGASVFSAALGSNVQTVVLTTSSLPDGNLTVTVNNVRDRSGNAVAANSQKNFPFSGRPFIQIQPSSTFANLGEAANYVVIASGNAPLSYQWYRNGSAIPGATGAAYVTGGTGPGDDKAVFSVTVANSLGSVQSAGASLRIWNLGGNNAAFVSQSVPTTMAAGQSYAVSITYENSDFSSGSVWSEGAGYRLGSQYPQDNTTWGGGRVGMNGEVIAGWQLKTFAFTVTAPSVPGTYNFQWRMVQDGREWFGDLTPNVAITVTGASATPPSITSQPASVTVIAGQTASFSVGASGTGPLSYQWKMNGSAIAGATGSTYSRPASIADNGALFSVVVSNSAGSKTSTDALLTVNPIVSQSGLQQGGFETPYAGPAGIWSSFVYRASGSAWTFSPDGGVSANGSGFTSSNPSAPEGAQVALLQGGGMISQSVNLAAGTYTITFLAAQRANWQASWQSVRVAIDGQPLGDFRPSGGGYELQGTAPCTLSAGVHTVSLSGLNPNGGDNTVFIDDVRMVASAGGLQQGGFESPYVGPAGVWTSFDYNANGAWTCSNGGGISANGSGFTSGNPSAPEGAQVGLVQGNGTLSQSANLAGGTYAITFLAAQRANGQASWQTVRVAVDGQKVGDFRPSGGFYEAQRTASFTVTGGFHAISIAGLNPNGGDNTAFVDDLRIVAGSVDPVDPSLVGYWKLDDGGATAADATGKGHTGSLVNGPQWTGGKISGALRFDGVDDQVTVADAADLRLSGNMTLAFWMYRSGPNNSDWQRLVGKGDQIRRAFGLWQCLGSDRRLLFQQYDDAGNPIVNLMTNGSPVDGAWTHVAVTVNGSTTTIYLNGGVDGITLRNGNAAISADPLTFGFAGFHQRFPGLLDDIRIYNRALNASEIGALANSAAPSGNG